MDAHQVFESLSKVQWLTARRTYGNSHATLIGLFVDWWIKLDSAHSVLEGSPSCNSAADAKSTDHAYCDALLCDQDLAVGIVELEGMRKKHTAEKLGKFFGSLATDLKELQFAMLLFYSCGPSGGKNGRSFANAITNEGLDATKKVSTNYPEKDIFLIGLEKEFQSERSGIRKRSHYYSGRVSKVHGVWYRSGECIREATFFAPNS